jgi:exonuclease VII large subunit
VKTYPTEISLGIVLFALFSFVSYNITKLQLLKRGIRKLKEEETLIAELMKAVQKETFQDKTGTMEGYREAMTQYEKRLSEIIEGIIDLESQRAHLLKFGGRKMGLRAERDRIIELIKQIQIDYLKKKKIETRSYEIRLESYNRRIGEIEENLATLEAQDAFKSQNILIGFFRSIWKKIRGVKKR